MRADARRGLRDADGAPQAVYAIRRIGRCQMKLIKEAGGRERVESWTPNTPIDQPKVNLLRNERERWCVSALCKGYTPKLVWTRISSIDNGDEHGSVVEMNSSE